MRVGGGESRANNRSVIFVSAPLAAILIVGGGAGTTGGSSGGAIANAATAPLPAVIARVDELYKRRDDRAAWHEEQRLVQALLARAPGD